jgi:glycosyltransferase involved in cell wall biosynthesis
MIEAMACGMPVIAYRAGSVPEIVEENVTGVVEGEEEAVHAVSRLGQIDRRRVRFEERFTANRMAKQYLDKYESLMRVRRLSKVI